MASQFCIKQGDTLLLNGALVQDDGTPIDITTVAIKSQLRDFRGNLVTNGSAAFASATPSTGLFTLTWQSDSTWPIGLLRCDVLYSSGTLHVHSETFLVMVNPAVTQA